MKFLKSGSFQHRVHNVRWMSDGHPNNAFIRDQSRVVTRQGHDIHGMYVGCRQQTSLTGLQLGWFVHKNTGRKRSDLGRPSDVVIIFKSGSFQRRVHNVRWMSDGHLNNEVIRDHSRVVTCQGHGIQGTYVGCREQTFDTDFNWDGSRTKRRDGKDPICDLRRMS
jgi:hypothetical protein